MQTQGMCVLSLQSVREWMAEIASFDQEPACNWGYRPLQHPFMVLPTPGAPLDPLNEHSTQMGKGQPSR